MVLRGLGLVIGWVPLVLLNYKGSAEPRHRCLCQCGNRPHWHSIVPDHMLSSHRHPAGPCPAESSGGAVQGVTQSWHGRSGKLAWSRLVGLLLNYKGSRGASCAPSVPVPQVARPSVYSPIIVPLTRS